MRRNYDFINLKEKEIEILEKLMLYANNYNKVPDKDQESYHLSYAAFIKFFACKSNRDLSLNDIIIGMSFTYSWMPTMLTIEILDGQEALLVRVLNKVHVQKEYLDEDELELLKKVVNNSLVGSSKLLHFISPDMYPIIDSRVMDFLFGGSSYERLVEPKFYLDYISYMKNLSNHSVVTELTMKLNTILKSNLAPLRALEFCMYGCAVEKAKLGKLEKLKKAG